VTPGDTTARCARHPEAEAAATCARCGAFACAACVRTGLDGRSYCAACEAFMPVALAWDGKGPVLRRWFSTAWALMTRPTVTLARAPPDGSAGASLGFALLAGMVGWLPTWGTFAALDAVSLLAGTSHQQSWGPGGAALKVFVEAFYAVGSVAGALGAAALVSVVEHAIVGGFGKGTAWTVSLRAHALSYAPAIVGLFPCCAWPVMLLWAVPLRVLALERFHGCTRARATVAVLTPVAVVGLGVLALMAASALIISSLMPKG
jgi:hypothetical protein